jgi:hypothetical protein
VLKKTLVLLKWKCFFKIYYEISFLEGCLCRYRTQELSFYQLGWILWTHIFHLFKPYYQTQCFWSVSGLISPSFITGASNFKNSPFRCNNSLGLNVENQIVAALEVHRILVGEIQILVFSRLLFRLSTIDVITAWKRSYHICQDITQDLEIFLCHLENLQKHQLVA